MSSPEDDSLLWEGTARHRGRWVVVTVRTGGVQLSGEEDDEEEIVCPLPLPLLLETECRRVDLRLIGNGEERESANESKLHHLLFNSDEDLDCFVEAVKSVDDGYQAVESNVAEFEPLLLNEFFSVDMMKDYRDCSDDTEDVLFYKAVKAYFAYIATVEAAWEERCSRRDEMQQTDISRIEEESSSSRSNIFKRAMGFRNVVVDRSESTISRFEDPLLAISPLSLCDTAATTDVCNLLQRMRTGENYKSYDDICSIATSLKQSFHDFLCSVAFRACDNIDDQESRPKINVESNVYASTDGMEQLKNCNVHQDLDYCSSVDSMASSHTFFPFVGVSPAAALVSTLSGRLVCHSTVQVKAVVECIINSAKVVALDNRFLDPHGLPQVYSDDVKVGELPVSQDYLLLEALRCNGGYYRNVSVVILFENATLNETMLCEIFIELYEIYSAQSMCAASERVEKFLPHIQKFFTRFRSWSILEPDDLDLTMEEAKISIHARYSRDTVYRTELLRQLLSLPLDEFLSQKSLYYDNGGSIEEVESDVDASNQSGGYFMALLQATLLTHDIPKMRSVCSLFCSLQMFSAAGILQKAIIEAVRSQHSGNSFILCQEIETNASSLIKESVELESDESLLDALSMLEEAISLRKSLDDTSLNRTFIMCDAFIISALHEEMDNKEKALEVLQEVCSDYPIEDPFIKCYIFPKLGSLHEQDQPDTAVQCYKLAVRMQAECLGNHSFLYQQTLLDLGLALLNIRESSEASEVISKLINTRHETSVMLSGRQYLLYQAATFMMEVVLCNVTGDIMKAKTLIEKALKVRIKLHGLHHTSVAECFVEYGLVCKSLGKYQHAASYFEDALKIYFEILGRESAEVANTMVHLGGTLELLEDYSTALSMYKMSLKIRRSLFGEQCSDVIEVLLRIGSLCLCEKLLDEADEILFECLSIQSVVSSFKVSTCQSPETIQFTLRGSSFSFPSSSTDPSLAETINTIAGVFKERAQLKDALYWYKLSLRITKKRLGARHPNIAIIWTQMATVLKQQNCLEEAIPLYEQALDLRRELCRDEPGRVHVAQSLNNLAIARQDAGEQSVAKGLFEEALTIYNTASGLNKSVEVAAIYNNLAGCIYNIDPSCIKAKAFGLKAVQMAEEVLGNDHSTTIRYRHNWCSEDAAK